MGLLDRVSVTSDDTLGCYVTWTDDQLYDWALIFDITMSSVQKGSMRITDHPVEIGPDASDNARIDPDEVRFTGLISSVPIRGDLLGGQVSVIRISPNFYQPPLWTLTGAVNALASLINGPQSYGMNVLNFFTQLDATPVADTLAVLRKLQSTKQLCNVVTPEFNYDSMMLKDFEMPRSPEHGTSAPFEMVWKKIVQVSTTLVTNPTPKNAENQVKVAKGNQGLSAPPVDKGSITYQLGQWAAGTPNGPQ